MRTLLTTIALCILLAGCSSSTEIKNGDDSSETKAIKKVITAYDSWAIEKDPKTLKNLFTENSEAIVYTATSEIWKGAANIRKKTQKDDKSQDVSVDIRDQDIRVGGNIAWFSERADFKFDYNGQRVSNEGLRMTGVLIKEDGQWKIVQWHTSVPVRTAQEQPQQQLQ